MGSKPNGTYLRALVIMNQLVISYAPTGASLLSNNVIVSYAMKNMAAIRAREYV
jgi:hypothetical protein